MARTIQHRPDRALPWKARYRAPDGKERSQSFRRKEDAERHLRNELTKIDRGEWIDPTAATIPFGVWAEEWFDALIVKPKTAASYRSLLDSRILPTFGSVELRHIKPAMVRKWVAKMAKGGLSTSRIRQARMVLHAALEQAVDDGLIPRNPTAKVKVAASQPREQRFLTAEQVSELAAVCESRQDGAGTLIRLLAYSGLRWGEAVALRAGAVDPLRRRIEVRESATLVNGELVWGKPKNDKPRTVVIPGFLADRLGVHMEGLDDPDALLFTSPRGQPLRTPNFARRVWRPAVAECGLGDLRVHDLRHTAASLMVSSGAPIKAVQQSLGHATAAITLDVYSHLYDDDLDALADALEERFAEADAAPTRPRADADVIEFPQKIVET